MAWFTLAPNDQEMRGAVEDLRAWVRLSFGWEDPRGAMVIPGEATGALGQLILTMSPAGYFRWQTTKGHADRGITKLRQMRSLEQARPRHAVVRLPSLFELRQEFAVALTAGDRQAAEGAVAAIDRRQLDSADNTLFMRIRLLEELCTDPAVSQDARLRRTLLSGLVELVDDFVKEPGFPRADLADVYLGLFRLWFSLKRGSVYPPDSQVLLELGEAALQFGRCHETAVIGLLRAWWEARPVKALLPFLLATVEMLDRLGSEGQCENFWILAGDFVRGDPDVLSPGERLLWRQVGARIGYDAGTLDEYVPLPEEVVAADPIRQAALEKLAIVSLRERQAQEAAGLLRERSDAQIVVVSETHPGADTRSALAADVVLFVWSATTHAVFRAFDAVDKKRFAYVQGTGATSIVLALERWIGKQEEAAGSA